ncbi:LysM peptidoglycan-binding domain-containing protein [Bacillus sp. FJAT-27445]|uniref:LysM peptidoglycan-binding domain-containing protein n=1 Tax=Bacillus sp. FJAT-27445 TaxID=1679166 RepID=UPI000743AD5A|nr:LysM peptidoglycan-binding domain-containing protein [Bacillus sp. FJAT-27445]
MKKDDPYLEQVEKHRKRIDRARPENGEKSKLPPRSRVHQNKKKKTKFKLKYPVIRLLVLFFILLPLTVFAVISSMEGNKSGPSSAKGGVELVDYDAGNQPEGKGSEPMDEDGKEVEGKSEDADPGIETKEGGAEGTDKEPNSSGSLNSGEGKDASNDNAPSGNTAIQPAPSNGGESIKEESGSAANEKSQGIVKYHTVKPGETLFRIAMMYYKSQDGIEKIRKANAVNGNDIMVGQTLKIPLN